MIHFIRHAFRVSVTASDQLEKLYPIAALIARCYIAQVFFQAGLTKIDSWDTTLFLFQEEYQVPLLAPELAAYLGTAGELFLPPLLLLGLATRFSALGLFVVNLVAVISLESIAPAALYLHVIWAILLAQLAINSGGLFSLDRMILSLQQKTALVPRGVG